MDVNWFRRSSTSTKTTKITPSAAAIRIGKEILPLIEAQRRKMVR